MEAPMFTSQRNEESLHMEDDCPTFDQYEAEETARSSHRGKVDAPYRIVSTVVLPVFLLFEWMGEWYGNVDFDDDWHTGPKVAAISGIFGMVVTHMVLTPMYLRRTNGSVRLHLVPVLSIIASNFLILVGQNIAPTCIIAGTMLFMVAMIHRSERRTLYNDGSRQMMNQRLLEESEGIDEEAQS